MEELGDLSPDLDWMLQSGQVDLPQLVHALVRETYIPLLHLAIFTFEDVQKAHQLIKQTILFTVEHAHRYQGEHPAFFWMLHLFYQLCQPLLGSRRLYERGLQAKHSTKPTNPYENTPLFPDLQNPHQRLCIALHLLFQLGAQEIAYVLSKPLPIVQKLLQESLPHSENHLSQDFIHKLQEQYTQLSLNIDFEQIANEIIHQAKQRKNRNNYWHITMTSALLGVVIFFLFMLVRAQEAFLFPSISPNETQLLIGNEQVIQMTQIIYITPTPTPSTSPTPYPKNAILYTTTSAGETLRYIATNIGVDLNILLALNSLPPDEPLPEGYTIVIGFGSPPLSLITPTPVTPAPLPKPLTLHSSQEDIRLRLLSSNRHWHTLWANILTIDYGPSGYVGSPTIRRSQIWISQPFYHLLLSGDTRGEPEHVSLMIAGRVYTLDLKTGQRSQYGSGGLYDTELQEIFFPDSYQFPNMSTFEIVGTEFINRRFTLIVDHFVIDQTFIDTSNFETKYYIGRYWMDVLTGLVLRKQQFDSNNPNLLIKEITVTDLALDINIPGRLFDLYQPLLNQFAKDYSGEPLPTTVPFFPPAWTPMPGREPLPLITPPPDFDPSQSTLTFHYTHLTRLGDESNRANLFAGQYYLGNIEFADPQRINCSRSISGNLIAFSEWREQPPYGVSSIRWFEINHPGKLHDPLPGLSTSDFTFSPDGRSLALIGCTMLSNCGIYRLDLETEKTQRIISLDYGYGLTWSPDGKFLALIGALKGAKDAGVIVVDVVSHKVVYTGFFDWAANLPAPDSPTYHWNVPFPSIHSGLDGCIVPLQPTK